MRKQTLSADISQYKPSYFKILLAQAKRNCKISLMLQGFPEDFSIFRSAAMDTSLIRKFYTTNKNSFTILMSTPHCESELWLTHQISNCLVMPAFSSPVGPASQSLSKCVSIFFTINLALNWSMAVMKIHTCLVPLWIMPQIWFIYARVCQSINRLQLWLLRKRSLVKTSCPY